MNGWSISTRIGAGFGIIVLLLIGIAAFSYLAVQGLGNGYSSYRATAKQTINVNFFVEDLFEARVAALKYRLAPSDQAKTEVVENVEEIIDLVAVDDVLSADEDFKSTLAEVRASAETYKLSFLEISTLMSGIYALRDGMYQSGQQAHDALATLSKLALDSGEIALLAAQAGTKQSLQLGQFYVLDYLVSEDSAQFDVALGHFDDALARLRQVDTLSATLQGGLQSAATDATAAAKSHIEEIRADMVAAQSSLNEVIRIQSEILDTSGPQMQSALEAMAEAIVERQDRLGPQGQQIVTRMNWMVPAAGVLSIVLAVMIAFVVALSIVRPISRLAKTTSQLADGKTDVTIIGAEHKHEIGRMAQALQVFRQSHIERDEMTKAAEHAFASQQDMVSSLSSGLDALAKGDLSHRVSKPFADEYETLRANFNTALSQLDKALNHVGSVSSVISESAGEINKSTVDLSRRTENQAATLEQTAAALDELTSSVRGTAKRSVDVKDAVQLARKDASESGDVVRRAVGAMDQIEKSSSEISTITEVISDIAFQTNLLALNAGVEAARAGDAGRGFAVVASEVSALAQRSADEAQDVSNLIDESAKQIQSGTAQVNAAGDALSKIIDRVDTVNGLIGEIATSSEEQAIGITEINNGVNELDRVTQQNAGMVEQSSERGQQLEAEAKELDRLMAGFTLANAAVNGGEETGKDEAPGGDHETMRLAG